MSIDLSEFHDIFFEECTEGLSVMESGLLTLDNGTDVEEINAIFRAAHSIKGGGASFGFTDISEFTHVMETLLDEMRDGRRQVTREIVDLLLESVDVLRDMVTAAKDDDECDETRTAEVKQKLERVLAGKDEDDGGGPDTEIGQAESQDSQESDDRTLKLWKIEFKPHADMLKGGNDPARIFRELETLGELTVVSDTSAVPPLDEIDPELSYLKWVLELRTDAAEESIREMFSWVEDESDLSITTIGEDKEKSASENNTESRRFRTEDCY